MHRDLCRALRAREIGWQRRERLKFGHASGGRIVPQGRHGRSHLVERIGKLAVLAKNKVARTRAWRKRSARGGHGFQLARGVQPVGDRSIESEIADEDKFPIRRKGHAMRMRAALAVCVGTASGMLYD